MFAFIIICLMCEISSAQVESTGASPNASPQATLSLTIISGIVLLLLSCNFDEPLLVIPVILVLLTGLVSAKTLCDDAGNCYQFTVTEMENRTAIKKQKTESKVKEGESKNETKKEKEKEQNLSFSEKNEKFSSFLEKLKPIVCPERTELQNSVRQLVILFTSQSPNVIRQKEAMSDRMSDYHDNVRSSAKSSYFKFATRSRNAHRLKDRIWEDIECYDKEELFVYMEEMSIRFEPMTFKALFGEQEIELVRHGDLYTYFSYLPCFVGKQCDLLVNRRSTSKWLIIWLALLIFTVLLTYRPPSFLRRKHQTLITVGLIVILVVLGIFQLI